MSSKNSSGVSYGKGRTRNYASVVYPDSAPEDWKERLSELKIPAFVSPLHDLDHNPDGEIKKAHWHVLIMFDSVKTKEQADEVFSSFGGVGCEVVNSLRGYARYLCHLDNPEKAQYDCDSVTAFGGADYMNAIGTSADKAKSTREMLNWIVDNNCVCFADLMLYASVNRSDWYDCLINSGAYVIKEFIKSWAWKTQHVEEK